MGSRGDSYDNALAETIIGLYKTELIRRRGPWGLDDLEYATLEWVDWFNQPTPGAHTPPAEFEAAFQREEDPSHPVRGGKGGGLMSSWCRR